VPRNQSTKSLQAVDNDEKTHRQTRGKTQTNNNVLHKT